MTQDTTTTSGAADLIAAAQAVVDRWDTPLWKDVPATAEYIGRLRAALAAWQATAAPQGVAYADAHGAIMGAAYDFRDAHISGSPNQKRSAHAALESAVTHALRASHGQAPATVQADSVQEDAARSERERICAAIKVEDDYCVEQGDYMLDSDDCIKIARGDWVRPDFSVDAARKQGENHD